MTRHRSFKRLVRARMEKTSESYTLARAALLAADDPNAGHGPALSVSDAVIRQKTGRGWEDWFNLLDAWGAAERPNTEVRRWVAGGHGIENWGSQAVTINYQRARGLLAIGEHPNGFAVTASKTVAVPLERLYAAFTDEVLREEWLPGGELRARTLLRPRSARFDWGESRTRVNIAFMAKGEGKSLAALQHERLTDAKEAEQMKAFWRERLAAMKKVVER